MQLRIDTQASTAGYSVLAYGSTVQRLDLHRYLDEYVQIEEWPAQSQLEVTAQGGMEVC